MRYQRTKADQLTTALLELLDKGFRKIDAAEILGITPQYVSILLNQEADRKYRESQWGGLPKGLVTVLRKRHLRFLDILSMPESKLRQIKGIGGIALAQIRIAKLKMGIFD